MAWAISDIRFGTDGAVSVSWGAACNVSLSGFNKANQLIVAAWFASSDHTPGSKSVKLRWRNKTDNPEGSFADFVTGSGELRAGTSAGALANGTTVTTESGCQTSAFSEEAENESPLQSESFSPAKNDPIETQWCVDMSNAGDSDEFEFEIYDVTGSESLGIFSYTVTIAAAAQTFYQNAGQAAMTITGVLNKQGHKDTGAHAMVIGGTLNKQGYKNVGEHSMAIAGTLDSITTFACAVGTYAMSIAGSLVKQTHKAMGGHSMAIAGSLIKQSYKAVGGYAVVIAGTLATATIFLQVVGEYTMSITGGLVKKTTIFIGSGIISPVGSLAKQTSISIGKASMSIAGALSKSYIPIAGGVLVKIIGARFKKIIGG